MCGAGLYEWAGLYGQAGLGGIYNIFFIVFFFVFFLSRSCKLNPRNDFLVVLRSIRPPHHPPQCPAFSLLFLSPFTAKQKRKKKKKMFGFQKEDDFENNLVLKEKKKKDNEEVVQCFIISMYLNTIMLLQYC